MSPRSITSVWPKLSSSSVTVALASASSPETKTLLGSPSVSGSDHHRRRSWCSASSPRGPPGGRAGPAPPSESVSLTKRVGGKPWEKSSGLLMSTSTLPARFSAPGLVEDVERDVAAWLTTSQLGPGGGVGVRGERDRRAGGRPRGVLLPAGVASGSRVPTTTWWPSSSSRPAMVRPTAPGAEHCDVHALQYGAATGLDQTCGARRRSAIASGPCPTPTRVPRRTGEVTAWFRPAATPPELPRPGGGAASYLATGATHRWRFGLYRWDMGPEPAVRRPLPPHVQRVVLRAVRTPPTLRRQGLVRRQARRLRLRPRGWTPRLPQRVREPASLLILFAPGAPREAYFEGLVEIAEGRWKPSQEELQAFFEEHDNIYV